MENKLIQVKLTDISYKEQGTHFHGKCTHRTGLGTRPKCLCHLLMDTLNFS